MPDPDFTIGQGDSAAVLSGTVLDSDGDPVSIAGADLLLRVAPISGGSAIIEAAAQNNQNGIGLDGTVGQWQYAWGTGGTAITDTAEPGFYLGQLEVTFQGGAVQTFPTPGYMLLKIEEQLPLTREPVYVTREEVKASREMTGYAFEDHEIDMAIGAASRAIDSACSRRFWRDDSAEHQRVYSARSPRRVIIDDLVELTALEVDRIGDGSYEEAWAPERYLLQPLNANADGKPWEWIETVRSAGWTFPCEYGRVRVTGRFGWEGVPDDVRMLTSILAAKFVLRVRQAPFGIVSIGLEQGALMRIARTDPDLSPIIASYARATPFI